MPFDPASTTALVPLRTGGKTRLAPSLDAEQRYALAGAMLADVGAALAMAGIGRVVVAAEGPAAAAAAAALDLEVLRDAPGHAGLDAALRHASTQLGDPAALLVVAGDLPRLTADDVTELLGRRAPVVLAPTVDGGTGGLLRRPASVIPTAYGPGSARRHRRLADATGTRAEVVHTPGFAHDVDTVDDLLALRTAPVGRATRRVLDQLDPRPTRRAAG